MAPNPRGSSQARFTEDSFVDAARGQGLQRLDLIPDNVSAKQYADSITQQLKSTDPQVRLAGFKRLDALERDGAPKAREAHEQLLRLIARQPGIGQRPAYSSSDL